MSIKRERERGRRAMQVVAERVADLLLRRMGAVFQPGRHKSAVKARANIILPVSSECESVCVCAAAPHYLTWTINLDAARTKPRKRSPFKLEARAALIIQQISHSISCAAQPRARSHCYAFSLICDSIRVLTTLFMFVFLFNNPLGFAVFAD
jgi:ribosomal protein L24E